MFLAFLRVELDTHCALFENYRWKSRSVVSIGDCVAAFFAPVVVRVGKIKTRIAGYKGNAPRADDAVDLSPAQVRYSNAEFWNSRVESATAAEDTESTESPLIASISQELHAKTNSNKRFAFFRPSPQKIRPVLLLEPPDA